MKEQAHFSQFDLKDDRDDHEAQLKAVEIYVNFLKSIQATSAVLMVGVSAFTATLGGVSAVGISYFFFSSLICYAFAIALSFFGISALIWPTWNNEVELGNFPLKFLFGCALVFFFAAMILSVLFFIF